jgi:protein phosphatase 4 regulatory subunit 3
VSSTSSTESATHGHVLRKKKSFSSGKDGPPKKIAISLAVKSSGSGGARERGE